MNEGDISLKRCTVIFNPKAGRGAYRRRLPDLRQSLRDVDLQASIYIVEDQHAIDREIEEHIGETDVIVAAGGDGTVNAVARSLLRYEDRPPLGIIPLGTGNDFRRSIGVPSRVTKAISVLQSGVVCEIDVGQVSWLEKDGGAEKQHLFVNALGFGIEAVVADQVHAAGYQSWMKSYLVTALRAIKSWHSLDVAVQAIDENEQPRGIFDGRMFAGTVSNGISSGGGFRISPEALVNDHLLDLFLLPEHSVTRILRMLPWIALGKHGYFPGVVLQQAREYMIESREGLCVHADGEVLTHRASKISIALHPSRLAVICDKSGRYVH